MKINIRRNCFETNSSSNHSLILTTKKDCEKDMCAFKEKKKKNRFISAGGFRKRVETKEEKCYFLGGLFDFDARQFGELSQKYKIFIKILEDNNETEILEKLKVNRENYLNYKVGDPYCRKFFGESVLDECTCCFYRTFKEFFDITNSDNPQKDMYDMLYEFIYGDGVMVPYEYI